MSVDVQALLCMWRKCDHPSCSLLSSVGCRIFSSGSALYGRLLGDGWVFPPVAVDSPAAGRPCSVAVSCLAVLLPDFLGFYTSVLSDEL